MADTPPADSLFDNAPGSSQYDPARPQDGIGGAEGRARLDALQGLFEKMQAGNPSRQTPRTKQFLPYLLVRAFAGDRGDRPIAKPFWESPDIWVTQGDPVATPEIPSTFGGTITAGVPNTVYAHVWNLGRAPILGVQVEFYWFDPTFAFDEAHAHLIGRARVDLGPRTSDACHKLVKCPAAWVPLFVNNGHECLVVRVAAVGDGLSAAHPWEAGADRHVAQRNLSVVGPGEDISKLIESLERTAEQGVRVVVLEVGEDGADARRLLGAGPVPGAGAPRELAALGADRLIEVYAPGCDPQVVARDGTIATLLAVAGVTELGAPTRVRPWAEYPGGVIRIAAYRGEQLLGGATLVT